VVGGVLALAFVSAAAGVHASGGGVRFAADSATVPCSPAWNRLIEQSVGTGDGEGHGPDIGSEEWQSVVEFRLGLRGRADLPKGGNETWCRLVDRVAGERRAATRGRGPGAAPPDPRGSEKAN